nr:MAG TPA: hypothetical protein [Caudoviricetes sp.]
MAQRKQFTFYESFFKAIARIKKKQDRADAYDMICAYALYQTEPDLDSVPDAVAIAFDLLRPVLDKAKERAESGKKGGSKPQANVKQTASSTEAPAKLGKTQSEKEKENEKENENENECEKECELEKNSFQKNQAPAVLPPDHTPTPQPKSAESSPFAFSPALDAKLRQWFVYKSQRREGYTPQGKQALLSQIAKYLESYPDSALCALIDECMAANWKSVVFDRLNKNPAAYLGKVPDASGRRPLDADEQAAIRRMFGGDAP